MEAKNTKIIIGLTIEEVEERKRNMNLKKKKSLSVEKDCKSVEMIFCLCVKKREL